jgi:hypothetical protein
MGSHCYDATFANVTFRHNPYDTVEGKTIIIASAASTNDYEYGYDANESANYAANESVDPVGFLPAEMTEYDVQGLYRQVPKEVNNYEGYTNFFIGQTVDGCPERDIVLLERLFQTEIDPNIRFYELFTKRQAYGRKHWHTVWVESQYKDAILQFSKGRALASFEGLYYARTVDGLSFITEQCHSQRGYGVPSNPIVVELIGDRSTVRPRGHRRFDNTPSQHWCC